MCDSTQLVLYVIIIFSNSVYALAAPLLPLLFDGMELPGSWVGLIFSMYSIAMILVSPALGTILDVVGQSNLLALGLFAMGTAILGLGCLKDSQNNLTVFASALFFRAIQGIASASLNTTCYAIAANKYPEQTEYMVGMLEAMSGIGLIVGFMGGSYIFATLGFEMTYFVFGGMLPVVAVIVRIAFGCIDSQANDPLEQHLLPEESAAVTPQSSPRSTDNEIASTQAGGPVTGDRHVTYVELLKCPRIVFAAISCCLSNVVFSAMEPVLALRMVDFSLTSVQTGVILSIFPLVYIFGTLLTPCIPARVDKRVTLMSSALLMGIFNVFIGPSQMFALPETLVLVVIGLVMSGSCMAPMTIPVLPEMIDAS